MRELLRKNGSAAQAYDRFQKWEKGDGDAEVKAGIVVCSFPDGYRSVSRK